MKSERTRRAFSFGKESPPRKSKNTPPPGKCTVKVAPPAELKGLVPLPFKPAQQTHGTCEVGGFEFPIDEVYITQGEGTISFTIKFTEPQFSHRADGWNNWHHTKLKISHPSVLFKEGIVRQVSMNYLHLNNIQYTLYGYF